LGALVVAGKLKFRFVPLCIGGKEVEEEIHIKIDSKGRLCIPPQIREKIGQTVTIRKTPEGYLITPGKSVNFLEEFCRVVSSEPKRKGTPKLVAPKEMKSVWRTDV
jgi:bifunctional DNA-binding transcriptional regulator/antitoxin component of YhaV-PrlF toxin-antitoxin module